MLSKKYLFISIFVSFFILFTSVITTKAEAANISIGSTSVLAGENISIPISITGAVDVKSFIIRVIYDGDLLTYTDYTSNYPTTGTTTFVEEAGGIGKKYIITWTSESPLTGDMIPVTINFTVKSPRTVTLPSAIQFGGAAGRFIYNSSNVDIKSTYTFTNGTITATPVTLSSIAITNPANKLSYYIGEDLDIGGLEVTGTYNDSSTQIETITASNITGFNSSSAVTGQELTITVGDKTTTYTIDVSEVPITLSSIRITNPADKLSYFTGDTLDITGLEITGTYSDASERVETITAEDNITGFSSSSAVTGQVLTITVGEETITYTIDIIAKPIIEIESISVLPGENISIPINIRNGIDVKNISFNFLYSGDLLTYNNLTSTGGTTTVTTGSGGTGLKVTPAWTATSPLNGDFTPTTLNFTVKSPITVTLPSAISFGGASGNSIKNSSNIEIKNDFTFSNGVISATPIALESIAITHPANKLSYYVGEDLDIGGLEVTGTNNDASTQIETITSGNITGFNSERVADNQTLTITVDEKTTTYNIRIRRRSSGGGGGGSVSTNNNTFIPVVTPVTTQEKLALNNSPVINPVVAIQKLVFKTATKVFRVGVRNEDVSTLQLYLNSHGYDCGIADGIFGNKTKGAVVAFQKANGLVPDGVVGPMTKGKME